MDQNNKYQTYFMGGMEAIGGGVLVVTLVLHSLIVWAVGQAWGESMAFFLGLVWMLAPIFFSFYFGIITKTPLYFGMFLVFNLRSDKLWFAYVIKEKKNQIRQKDMFALVYNKCKYTWFFHKSRFFFPDIISLSGLSSNNTNRNTKFEAISSH